MMFALTNQNVTLAHVNARVEMHGEEREPAADLKFSVMLPNTVLNQFHPALLNMLYFNDATKQRDLADQGSPDVVPDLRMESLGMPIKWNGEMVGGRLAIHIGVDEQSWLIFSTIKVNEFRINAHDGGICEIVFRVQCHPNEHQFGKLCQMIQQEIPLTLAPPSADVLTLPAANDAPPAA